MLVVNLVGASASGKTTLAHQLRDRYNVIQSYTTRPQREPDEWGHTHITRGFLSHNNYYSFSATGEVYENVVAYAELYGEHYFATEEQFNDDVNIYVVDPDGAEQVKEYFKDRDDVRVITIMLYVPTEIRLQRLAKRDGVDGLKRVVADNKIFLFNREDYDHILVDNRVGDFIEVIDAYREAM